LNTVVQNDDDDDDDERRTGQRAGDADTQQLNGILNECIILLRAVMALVGFILLMCYQFTCQSE